MLLFAYVYLLQVYDRLEANNKVVNPPLVSLPANPTNASHGTVFYNKTRVPVGWYWGNETLNVTSASVLVSGPTDASLRVVVQSCPVKGCNVLQPVAADFRWGATCLLLLMQNRIVGFDKVVSLQPPQMSCHLKYAAAAVDAVLCCSPICCAYGRNGTLLWSANATWANTTGGKPVAGSNVTIPYGWTLVIDESPPPLTLLLIEGAVSFSNTTNITLTATYIVVQNRGVLAAGQPQQPHPAAVSILLAGTRNTPQLAINSNLVLGSKVRGAVDPWATFSDLQYTV